MVRTHVQSPLTFELHRFGEVELLEFATVINPRVPGRMSWIPGILDSGT
jgi:hypothetical protein